MTRNDLALVAFAAVLPACGDSGERSAAVPPEPSSRDLVETLPAGVEVPPGMVFVPGGTFEIRGESVDVRGFLLDAHEVTNDEFAAFVEATGHETDAERLGNSVCFHPDAYARGEPVFSVVEGADWRHPEGPESSLEGRGDHPVVHVSWNDARAYAEWAGKRLAGYHEWIVASRGGAPDPAYPWGDELVPDGRHAVNAWQGLFPAHDEGADGYRGTAPVGSYPPNPFGLHDVSGNVWEWTVERRRGHVAGLEGEHVVALVTGGSFLCREEAAPGFHACRGYLVGSLEWKPLEDGNANVGFRCARDVP